MPAAAGIPTPQRWRSLWRALGARGDEELYHEMLARYQDPARHYHTIQHLEEIFALWPSVEPLAEHPAEVELAIWFHDAVYVPGRGDNEARSADWARAALLAAGANEGVGERVHALVLATRHDATPADIDAMVLVDLDLAILGADPERFDQYEHQVRAEHAAVPVDVFRERRREILEGFLARPRIYRTAPLFGMREAQARENLRRSIARLLE